MQMQCGLDMFLLPGLKDHSYGEVDRLIKREIPARQSKTTAGRSSSIRSRRAAGNSGWRLTLIQPRKGAERIPELWERKTEPVGHAPRLLLVSMAIQGFSWHGWIPISTYIYEK
jgi:hypothetical protein